MSESARRTVQTICGVAGIIMLVVGLSALAVVRADNRDANLVAADQPATGGDAFVPGAAPGTDSGSSGDVSPSGDATTPSAGSGDTGAATAPSGTPSGGAAPSGAAGAPAPSAGGGQCADYNPNEGVFCDHWVVGGTTVLSGPLAIYGDQGVRGGQAWIEFFRTTIAPREHVRPPKLVFYDDGIDPNKTLQFVQRLVEVDKVLLIAGVTSPEAVGDYLDSKQVPMIGDIGLSPKSYLNDMIFPTAAPYEVRSDLRIAIAKKAYPTIKKLAVVQEILPGVNPAPIDKGWRDAAKKHGMDLVFYSSDLSSTDSTCKGHMLSAIRSQPDFIMLPVAAGTMLACVNEAGAKPGEGALTTVQNWGGGSNLQFEVDQCKELCYGMFSAGTPFLDPRENPSQNAKDYLANMAKYAPGRDVTGFIAINYYHAGLLQYEVMKQAGILHNLSRKNVIAAAKKFGPFETGFGNTVTWRDTVPRIPTTCGYNVILDPKQKRWVFGKEK
ncbi:MAG: branched-chain amino acid transport system substrate-binding protein, partial [Actinomycetota bacterium]|nr:branched-chain amino acid transport system substrate-binding protein [Actinomycetota bacterium]